jgi:hypothetical protein
MDNSLFDSGSDGFDYTQLFPDSASFDSTGDNNTDTPLTFSPSVSANATNSQIAAANNATGGNATAGGQSFWGSLGSALTSTLQTGLQTGVSAGTAALQKQIGGTTATAKPAGANVVNNAAPTSNKTTLYVIGAAVLAVILFIVLGKKRK